MGYEDYIFDLEPIIAKACARYSGLKTPREDLEQEAHLRLFECIDKLDAAGPKFAAVAYRIVENRFHELYEIEHKQGLWAQAELSAAVLARPCDDITGFDDEYFDKKRKKWREYYHKNRERILSRVKERRCNDPEFRNRDRENCRKYRETHKDKIRECNKRYYEAHKAERREYARKYSEAHKEERREHDREHGRKYCETHKDETRERQKRYREAHKEERREYMRKYREAHKEKWREYGRKYYKTHNIKQIEYEETE